MGKFVRAINGQFGVNFGNNQRDQSVSAAERVNQLFSDNCQFYFDLYFVCDFYENEKEIGKMGRSGAGDGVCNVYGSGIGKEIDWRPRIRGVKPVNNLLFQRHSPPRN